MERAHGDNGTIIKEDSQQDFYIAADLPSFFYFDLGVSDASIVMTETWFLGLTHKPRTSDHYGEDVGIIAHSPLQFPNGDASAQSLVAIV